MMYRQLVAVPIYSCLLWLSSVPDWDRIQLLSCTIRSLTQIFARFPCNYLGPQWTWPPFDRWSRLKRLYISRSRQCTCLAWPVLLSWMHQYPSLYVCRAQVWIFVEHQFTNNSDAYFECMLLGPCCQQATCSGQTIPIADDIHWESLTEVADWTLLIQSPDHFVPC